MSETGYVPLAKFELEPTLDDQFWLEKVKRSIQECTSIKDVKEMATLLAKIATQRQGVIRGLVKDIHVFNNVVINPDDLANPQVTTED